MTYIEYFSPPKTYIFNAEQSCFASAVFSTFELAQLWIEKHGLTGQLTEYPLDQGCYDWAKEKGYFVQKTPIDRAPIFIGKFVSAHQKRWYFEHGEQLQSFFTPLHSN